MMKMNLGMLSYLLRTPLPEAAVPELTFSNIQIDTGQIRENHTLYLSDSRGKPEESQLLLLPSSVEVNRALELHQEYLRWREQCLRYGYVDHDLNTLLELCADFLGWDIYIVSPDYRMEAGSVQRFIKDIQMFSHMSKTEVETLYSENPRFDDTFRLKGIQPYPQLWAPNTKLFYYNLFQENLYLGRLLFTVPMDGDEVGMLALMAQVCEDVESCYRFLYLRRRQDDSSYRFYDLWKSLIEGQTVDQSEAQAALRHMGWQVTDTYQILYLVPAGYVQSQQTLKYYAVQLESSLQGCVAAELEDGVYCLHNLSADPSGDFRQQLGEFLRENLFRVGISNPFQDFFDSRLYRLQAQDAMYFGRQRAPDVWRYEFCDYVGDYVLAQATSLYPARDLCPKNLRKLIEFDEANPGSDLVRTLRLYYTCQFNAQLAAQRLFTHRTTFFYRMNKIQKIAAFHPEDPAETCQILLAFAAMAESELEG